MIYKHRVTAYLRDNRSNRRDALDDIDWRYTCHGCFCLKASAEVKSADHLYPVEDGFRKQYADFGGESKRLRDKESTSRRALALAYAIVIANAYKPPQ